MIYSLPSLLYPFENDRFGGGGGGGGGLGPPYFALILQKCVLFGTLCKFHLAPSF